MMMWLVIGALALLVSWRIAAIVMLISSRDVKEDDK